MKLVILIPTLGRPAVLKGLVENIRETTPQKHEIVFVLDPGDAVSMKPLINIGGITIKITGGTYPKKTNAGYATSSSELVLPTADDVVFTKDWLLPVLEAFRDPKVDVVGTNDLSPMSNENHATMPVIRRSYIENPGSSWRERGKVFHEGFHHNFVETEVCGLAITRGVWGYAPDAVIEHRHPSWGTREIDETDRKGWQQKYEVDAQLYERRKAEWAKPTQNS